MADRSAIEWTDASWNPIRARATATGKVGWFCTHVSEGCRNCYAEGFNARLGTGVDYKPAAIKARPGEAAPVDLFLDEAMLTQPLRWRRPRRIFVGSMTDLFADFVPDEWLDRIFAVMALAPQHTFQLLTKRPERARAYLADADRRMLIADAAWDITAARPFKENDPEAHEAFLMQHTGGAKLPLPNVWLGTSIEDQATADARIPELLATPAALHWVSAEPLLGPIDLTRVGRNDLGLVGDALRWRGFSGPSRSFGPRVAWAVVGGESGPKARPMHPAWARQLRDQCAAAGVPFVFKQWGDWEPRDEWAVGVKAPPMRAIMPDGSPVSDDVAPQDVGGWRMARVGKKAAGRLLDGRLHDAYPEGRP